LPTCVKCHTPSEALTSGHCPACVPLLDFPDDNLVGQTLGEYRLTRIVGQGGMGVVYAGEHLQLGRKVAIKLLRSERAAEQNAARRFINEAKAIGALGHPNIVEIINLVEDWQTSPPLIYMVMELLEGIDLAQRVATVGQLAAEEVAWLGVQIADALETVHQANILHRDLKPENIFLVPQKNGDTRVKLLDFGVAKLLDQPQLDSLTGPGMAVGTPQYMAPEHVLGETLDQRADIYGLGLVLYEMLTATVAFDATQEGEVMVRQVHEPVIPIADLRDPGKPLAPALEAVIMCCLAKSRHDRYPSAAALKDALIEASAAADDPLVPLDAGDEDDFDAPKTLHFIRPSPIAPRTTPGDVGVGPAPRVHLVVALGRRRVGEFTLDSTLVRIGREADQDVLIENSSVSRFHCVIRHKRGQCFVVDLDTSNGTTLNGKSIKVERLSPGDQIGVGKYIVFFQPNHRQLEKLESATIAAVAGAAAVPETTYLRRDELDALRLGQTKALSAQLVRIAGRPEAVTIAPGGAILGNAPDATVKLEGWLIRGHHAVISKSNFAYTIRKLGRWRSVFVNGESVSAQVLNNKDQIRIGNNRFEFLDAVSES